MRACRHTLRIFAWQLASMPEYSCTLPDDTTFFRMWKRDLNEPGRHHGKLPHNTPPKWVVGQYHPIEGKPDLAGIRWFSIVYLEGPMPPGWRPPDWHNDRTSRLTASP